jgi:hypothetical protein
MQFTQCTHAELHDSVVIPFALRPENEELFVGEPAADSGVSAAAVPSVIRRRFATIPALSELDNGRNNTQRRRL